MSFYFNLKSFRLGILYGIVTAFIFTLCACGEEENSPVPEKPEEEEEVFLNLPEASMSHTFSSDGGVFSVDFTSSHAWTAEVASGVVSWLHVSPEQGEGGASTIQITADENTGDTPRTGTVTIRSGELSRTISVTQQERVLDLPEASMSHTFSSDGGVFSVDFTSSHAWTAEVASGVVSWLHVSPEQGEGGASTIQITADENTGDTPRTGTVTIRSGELSRTISVTQQGRVLDLPEASMSHTFSSDGGVFSVDFTSSHAWTAEVASGVVSWLHVSPEQGEGGASTIQITADENTGDTPRTGTVTIRSGELSRTISVTQQERVIVPGSDGPDDMPIEPW